MRNVLFVVILCFFTIACKKNINKISDEIAADIGPVNPYVWTAMPLPVFPNPYPHQNNREPVVDVNNAVAYSGMGTYDEVEYKFINAATGWQALTGNKNFFPHGVQSFTLLFNYNNSRYWGLSDWDPYITPELFIRRTVDSDESETLASFPGTPVKYPLTFVVGNKGYVLGGTIGNTTSNQFWEYDFASNQWTNRGISPLGRRAGAIGFVKDNKVYAGLGFDKTTLNNQPVIFYKNDWIQFDPTTTSGLSAIKADFPGTKRGFAKGFSINNKFYIGWGEGSGSVFFNDFWEYNPATNGWNEKSNCPAVSLSRNNIQVFSIGNTGYLVKGGLYQFWRYSNSTLIPTN